MQVYKTLAKAKKEGCILGRQGLFPTVYTRGNSEYILVPGKIMPPEDFWPVLKWVGRSPSLDLYTYEWIPILSKLDSLERTLLAYGLFQLLGYEPVIVQYSKRRIFDLFIKDSLVPRDSHIIGVTTPNGTFIHLHTISE